MTIQKRTLIRAIYLYSFSLLGLVLIIIGSVQFIDMGLRTFIFTQADEQDRLNRYETPYPPLAYSKTQLSEQTLSCSPEEEAALEQWATDYQVWQEKQAKFDYVAANRSRDASINLSLILVGLPLFLYHWLIIRKEAKAIKG
jgi:hypothetical protein